MKVDRGSWAEFWWLVRHGKFRSCWQWPFIFGVGRGWYDGPYYYLHCGLFSVDLWTD